MDYLMRNNVEYSKVLFELANMLAENKSRVIDNSGEGGVQFGTNAGVVRLQIYEGDFHFTRTSLQMLRGKSPRRP